VLVGADELAGLVSSDSTLVCVDCRFRLLAPEAGFKAYLEGHIPGARYAHLDKDLAGPAGPGDGRHPLPSPDAFAATLAAWGIDRESLVVAYDDAGGAIAARLWWMLGWLGHRRRRLLNGGLQAWRAAGLGVEAGLPGWTAARYEYDAADMAAIATAAELGAAGKGAMTLLDARSAQRFRGEAEPIDPVAGHVPGARNLPSDSVLNAEGLFRSPEELRVLFAEQSDEGSGREVVSMCGSGVTACQLLAARALAELTPGRLYVGSWSEWIRDPARPIARAD
jgi:thiosulfate/3-mercaptopyruvate sulfurtransferase